MGRGLRLSRSGLRRPKTYFNRPAPASSSGAASSYSTRSRADREIAILPLMSRNVLRPLGAGAEFKVHTLHTCQIGIKHRKNHVETPVSCCDETTARIPDTDVSRRALFKGAALVASVIPAARPTPSEAQGKEIKLANFSQLLCGVPYEVARSAGYFKHHGLD